MLFWGGSGRRSRQVLWTGYLNTQNRSSFFLSVVCSRKYNQGGWRIPLQILHCSFWVCLRNSRKVEGHNNLSGFTLKIKSWIPWIFLLYFFHTYCFQLFCCNLLLLASSLSKYLGSSQGHVLLLAQNFYLDLSLPHISASINICFSVLCPVHCHQHSCFPI